jgi:hypothetical protein
MRDHGVPRFPNPLADGTFPIRGTAMDVLDNVRPEVTQARNACLRFEDEWRVRPS